MRMWMLPCHLLCQKHLCGEAVEIHMAVGRMKKGKSLNGWTSRGLLEPTMFSQRHDALAAEMLSRGYKHNSPLPNYSLIDLMPEERQGKVNREKSRRDLMARCRKCRGRIWGESYVEKTSIAARSDCEGGRV